MLKTLDSTKEKAGGQGFKMALNPRLGHLGFSVEETKSSDQVFVHQSPRRTEGKKVSVSEVHDFLGNAVQK